MAGFLSSMGITSPVAPPASAYSDQQAETANLADAKSQLMGVTSNIGLATTTAKQLGLDPAYTQSLDNLNNEAANLATKNLSSAQLSAQTTALQNKLTDAKTTQEAAVKQKELDDMTAASNAISERLAAVKADSTAPAENVKQYDELNTAAQAALKALKDPPKDLSGAIIHPNPTALLAKVDDIDTALDAAQNKVFNWKRFMKKVVNQIMYWTAMIACGVGFVLGGIIMSNAYAADHFWAIKVFYFIYGAAFFPLSVVYGVIKSPYWVAGLIPIFSLVPRAVPTEPPPLPAPPAPKPVKTSVASLKSAVTSKLTSMIKMPKLFGGGDDDLDLPPTFAPAVAPVARGPPTVSLTTRLFGYKLVDPATPTPAETSAKTLLRILAGVDSALLLTIGVYYGVDKLILKNKK